jgi:hypothetical protein
MARGYSEGSNGRRKIAVALDNDVFQYINSEAWDEACSSEHARKPNFASVLRRLLQKGIEAEKAARPVLKRKDVK